MFRQNQQLLVSFSQRAFQAAGHSRSASSASGSPSPGLMASVLAFPKAQPFAFNIMIATVKTSIADLITQTTIEQKSEIDWKRNGVFVVFGMLYLGGFQYWLQVNMFRKWFPTMDRTGCTKYYNNFRKDFTAMFSLWFPADCVIFAVPIWLRLPAVLLLTTISCTDQAP
eukprot:jgi/Tetstr1/445882/TSEL_003520.t1